MSKYRNDDRVLRYGAHLLATARSLGWKDDGEGALEFLMRRTREVAIEDCADEIERLRAVIIRAKDALLDGQSTQRVHDLLMGALLGGKT